MFVRLIGRSPDSSYNSEEVLVKAVTVMTSAHIYCSTCRSTDPFSLNICDQSQI